VCVLRCSCYVGRVLNLFRRHRAECPGRSKGRRYRRCDCPIHVEGSLRGEYVRKALNLTSWEAASDLVAAWTASGEIGVVKPEAPSVKEAVTRFFEDAEARGLKPATISKYKVLLEKQLLPWCDGKGYTRLKQLGVDELTRFRATWQDGPLSMLKKQERLAAFFHFCRVRHWIRENPVLSIRLPEVTPSPTLPFTREEMKKILDACDRYSLKGIYGEENRKRMRAMVLLLRYSGLRIRDAVCLRREKLNGNGILLYTQKTGTPVYVPVPEALRTALRDLKPVNDEYFFWSGNGEPKSAVADWQRALRKLFALADVKNGHAHRFRDTFAVELLLAGVPLEDVSVLLGHSDVKITLKHYAPWVKERQVRLEERVRQAWTEDVPA
jgi:integrase/recombinase XerD